MIVQSLPSSLCFSPKEAIMEILKACGIENFVLSASLSRPGELSIITDVELSYYIKEKIDAVRPIGVLITYEVRHPELKNCICFGPPMRCCPVHGG